MLSIWTSLKFCRLVKSSTHTPQKKFRLVQIESTCRRKIECRSKDETLTLKEQKIMRKGENAGYQHFFVFPQCF